MAPPDVDVTTPDDPGRDDPGRDDESPGFDVQARIFIRIGLFLVVVAIGYWWRSYEWAGTTMLALASGMSFTFGVYVGWKKPAPGPSVREPDTGADHEEPWFPAASGWPFALAVAMVLVANGLLLGLWLLLPAGAFLAFAVGGFIVQSRSRG